MEESLRSRVLSYRWLIFGIMALAFMFVYFHRQCAAVVAIDLQKEFHASAGLVGLLASAYFYPYALLQLPAGLLSDSLGPRATSTLFLLIAVAGSVLLGLAPTVEVAVAARVMVGVGVSMVFIPTMKLLSQWFRVSEFAFMVAIMNIVAGIGVYLATKPLAAFAGWVGWRASFEVIGVGTLFVAAAVWAIVRNRPQDMGWPALADMDQLGSGAAPAARQIPLRLGIRMVLTEPGFWPLAAWFFLSSGGAFFSFAGLWAGPYLQHVYGMSRSEAGDVLGMIALGLIVGSPFMSFLSDRVFKSRKKVLILSTAALAAELVVLNLNPVGFSKPALYGLVFFFCVSASSVVPVAFAATKELFPVQIAGTSVGTVNLFPFLGAAIMQIVLGWVLDAYPRTAGGAYPLEAYSSVLQFLLGAVLIALMCTFFMKETFPPATPPQQPRA
ncbi:MAG: MFS transporter [Desulfomonile sp.]|nr:MFS transporter [Desulfomonile sp.]